MWHGLGVTEESRRPMGRPQIPEADMPPPQQLGEDASPEEQDLYDRVVAMAITMIWSKKMMPKTLKLIEQSDDPVNAVAEVVSQVGTRVYSKAKKDGIDIPGDILLHAGEEMVEEVINLAETAGVAEFTPQQAEAAFYAAADKFGQTGRKMGVYSDEQAQSDMAELDRMADAGELDEMVSQIKAARQGGLG